MSLPRYRLAMPSRLVWSMEESPLINCFFWSMDGSHLIDCTAAGPFGIVVGCPVFKAILLFKVIPAYLVPSLWETQETASNTDVCRYQSNTNPNSNFLSRGDDFRTLLIEVSWPWRHVGFRRGTALPGSTVVDQTGGRTIHKWTTLMILLEPHTSCVPQPLIFTEVHWRLRGCAWKYLVSSPRCPLQNSVVIGWVSVSYLLLHTRLLHSFFLFF